MNYSKGVATVDNPLRAGIAAIDDSGIDYDAYDKNNYFLDFLQDAWGWATGDSNWGDSQNADNRKKAEQYAYELFNGNTNTYSDLDSNDFIVSDKIRNMYDVDEQKGLGFLTGAADWIGDKIYDRSTQSDDSRAILGQLLQGGQEFDMYYGDDETPYTYTLGKELYNAILNDDFDYVDNLLRTVGADLSAAGKSWDDLSSDEKKALALNYNQNFSRQEGEDGGLSAYETNRQAAENGDASPMTLGNRSGSTNGLLFSENGKYNALAGNSNAANILDGLDMAATAGSLFIPGVGLVNGGAKGAGLLSRGANFFSKGAKAASAADKAADTTRVATAAERLASDANKGAKVVDATSDAAKASNTASKMAEPATTAIAKWDPLIAARNVVQDAPSGTSKIVDNAQRAGSSYGRFNVPVIGQRARDTRAVRNSVRDAEKAGSKAARGGKSARIENPYSDPKKIDEMNNVLSEKGLTGLSEDQRALYNSIMRTGGIKGNARNAARFMTRPRNIALGASGSDVVMSPINAVYQNTTGSLLPEQYDDRWRFLKNVGAANAMMGQDPYSFYSMQ